LYSPAYFSVCAVGGALSCGLTHAWLTPLDLVKCNSQANPALVERGALPTLRALYSGALSPFGFEGGLRGLFRGWAPTLVGYSVQGAFKFGLYEYFKHRLMESLDPLSAFHYRDFVYVGSSSAAEAVADVALCPFEAVKVRVQTSPGYARGLTVSSQERTHSGGERV
jgi:solute carrier family 25 phosphate transporter 3